MKTIYPLEQTVFLTFLMVFVSCYVAPSPIYKLDPVSENTFWLLGQEYTRTNNENIDIAFAFARMIDGNLIFDIEITNISDHTILIAPEKFYFHAIQSIDDSTGNQNNKIFAIDPEMKLYEIDSKISQKTATYKSNTDNALSLLDLVSDVSTIGKEKTKEEIEKENEEDRNREEHEYTRDENFNREIYNLNFLRDEWELSTIRKTSLLPNTFIQGRLYFPFRTYSKYIKIYIPVKEDLLNLVFLVEKHSF